TAMGGGRPPPCTKVGGPDGSRPRSTGQVHFPRNRAPRLPDEPLEAPNRRELHIAATSAHRILHGGSSDRGRRSLGERATPTALSVRIDDLLSEHASRLFESALALTRDRTDARSLRQDACLRALEYWHR